MIENLSKVLPQLAIIAALAGILGWWIRGLASKETPAKAAPAGEAKSERVKNLETALEKSRTAHRATKTDLEALQAASVAKDAHETVISELEEARKGLDGSSKRLAALEADFKKSQETIKNLNNRSNEADQARKDKSFALENELSKVRAELATLQNRPDDSTGLLAEIERLREAVATSTRYAGELRKRETAALETLEKTRAQMASLSAASKATPASDKPAAPAGESQRVTAAKAEVLRLLEQNRQRENSPVAPAVEEPSPPVSEVEAEVKAESIAAAPETVSAQPEALPESAPEPLPTVAEEKPATLPEPAPAKKPAAPGELFALD